jgi:CcmD family protein
MSYAVAGYAITFVSIGLYSLRLIRRGRKLAATLPAEERTWK